MRTTKLGALLTALSLTVALFSTMKASAMEFSLQRGTLLCDNRPVLENVPRGFAMVEDPTGAGVFLRFTAANTSSFIQRPLGKIAGLSRFTSTHRYEPFWMRPKAGLSHADVQFETQWLLAETKGGDCVMLVPMIDGPFRYSISGSDAGLVLNRRDRRSVHLWRRGHGAFRIRGPRSLSNGRRRRKGGNEAAGHRQTPQRKTSARFCRSFRLVHLGFVLQGGFGRQGPHRTGIVQGRRRGASLSDPRRRLAGLQDRCPPAMSAWYRWAPISSVLAAILRLL